MHSLDKLRSLLTLLILPSFRTALSQSSTDSYAAASIDLLDSVSDA
jgi:hypothetical protein